MRYVRSICAALIALAALAACGVADQPAASPPTAAAPVAAAPTAAPTDAPTRGPVPEPPPRCGAAVAAKPGQPLPTPALCPTPASGPTVMPVTSGETITATLSGTAGPLAADATPRAIDLAELVQTLELRVGETFRLKLSGEMDWTITIGDERIVARAPADQPGVYIALAPGSTAILAAGSPACLKSQPACLQPSIAQQIQVTVR